MNYDEFVSAVEAQVSLNKEPAVEVRIHTVKKNNGIAKTGLIFAESESRVSPTIYLEEYYVQYEEGRTVSDIAASILELYQEIRVDITWDGEDLSKYQLVKDQIAYRLINREDNQDLLPEIPYRDYLDLALVYYVLLEVSGKGTATLLIRNEHMKTWKIDEEMLYHQACQNTIKLLPPKLASMNEVIAELLGEEELSEDEIDMESDRMYVLTNNIRSQGAAVLLYDKIFDTITEAAGESFYILPSSIHEMIIIPERESISSRDLETMVSEMNETQVDPEEVLSNHVYYYNKKEDPVLKIVRHD